MGVGWTHSPAEDSEENRMTGRVRGTPAVFTVLTWHLVSSDLWTWTEALAFLGIRPAGFQTWNYIISSPGSQTFRLRLEWSTSPPSWVSSSLNANLGLLSLHNSLYKTLSLLSLFLCINFTRTHTHILLVLFLRRILMNAGSIRQQS